MLSLRVILTVNLVGAFSEEAEWSSSCEVSEAPEEATEKVGGFIAAQNVFRLRIDKPT